VIFIDETTFNLWQRPTKLWMRRDDTGKTFQSNRGKSISMLGAIDHQVGLRYISIFEGSNNAATFTQFLDGLHLKIGHLKATLVLDNLSVHHSKQVRKWLETHP